MYTVWASTNSIAQYIIDNTSLKNVHPSDIRVRCLVESDAAKPNEFHRLPTHIKNILYLDSPDVIVEKDLEPVFTLEISTEAGTGHNAFQRFARIAASVEREIPAFYVYPESVPVQRQGAILREDVLNPLVFRALEDVMRIYEIPAFLFYFPKLRYSLAEGMPPNKGLEHSELYPGCPAEKRGMIPGLFKLLNMVLASKHPAKDCLKNLEFREHRDWMLSQYSEKAGEKKQDEMSPISATIEIDTSTLLGHLRQYTKRTHEFGDMLPQREKTIVYFADAKFRGDPYPGALAAIDYIKCRIGKTHEERAKNLVFCWGRPVVENGKLRVEGDPTQSIKEFMDSVKATYSNNVLLAENFSNLKKKDWIPRYFMQVRFGSTFTKVKHIRVFAYFCDAIIFPDGALWREG